MGIKKEVKEITTTYCDTCGATEGDVFFIAYYLSNNPSMYRIHVCSIACYNMWVDTHQVNKGQKAGGMNAPTTSSEPSATPTYGPNEFRAESTKYYVLHTNERGTEWMRGAFDTLQAAKEISASLSEVKIYKHTTISEQRRVV